MKTIPVNIVVSDEVYELVASGALKLCGMVKDNGNVVRKHLPAVISTATKASKLSVHDVIALAQLGFTAVSVVGTGVKYAHDFYVEHKQNREKEQEVIQEQPDNIIYFDEILKAQNKKKCAL